MGINPNIIVLRSDKPLEESIFQKISLFCNVQTGLRDWEQDVTEPLRSTADVGKVRIFRCCLQRTSH